MSKKPADVPRRNDPTMTKITRNGSVKFCLDGRCGNKVKFTNAWVFSQIKPAGMFDNVMMTGLKKVSETSRKTGKPTKKRYPNRMCACGDKYCNHISKFLGTIITEKCCYQHPDRCNKNHNRQLRCEKIHHHLVTCRKTRNDLFKRSVSEAPPKDVRFNEIHYSISFLMRVVKICKTKRSVRRIPESIDVEVATETNMFSKDLVCYYTHHRKHRVVVVPTLNAHQAIQV